MPNNKLAIPLVGAEEIAPTSTPRTEKKPAERQPGPIFTPILIPSEKVEREEVEGVVPSLGEPCCDTICRDLNKEIDYRELSIGKTYIKRYPIPRATARPEKSRVIKTDGEEYINYHPAPTIDEVEYPSPVYDAEALIDFRNVLEKKQPCKCSNLKMDYTEDETKELVSGTRSLTKFSPLVLRQIYRRDVPIPNSQLPSANTDVQGHCVDMCANTCKTLNSHIGKLEKILNEQELMFKGRPLAKYESKIYVPNIYKLHMLKEYRSDIKRKNLCKCIE